MVLGEFYSTPSAMKPQSLYTHNRGINALKCCQTKTMKSSPEKLVKKHEKLTHSDTRKVTSHVQRNTDDWIINTLMIEGCEVPFKYKRTKLYKNLTGQRVNLTYYPDTETIAGMEFDVMNVVRIKVS